MRKEIKVNVPMDALMSDPELFSEYMEERFDNQPLDSEGKAEVLDNIVHTLTGVLGDFLENPTDKRISAINACMQMYKYFLAR